MTASIPENRSQLNHLSLRWTKHGQGQLSGVTVSERGAGRGLAVHEQHLLERAGECGRLA